MRENNPFRIIIISCYLHVRSPGPPQTGAPPPQSHSKSLQEMPGSITEVVRLVPAAMLGDAPGSSGTPCVLNHARLTEPCEVDTNIIPILPMGKLRPRALPIYPTVHSQKWQPGSVWLYKLCSGPYVVISPHGKAGRREGPASESPSGSGPLGRAAPLPQRQGWVTWTQGRSQTEPQRPGQAGPGKPVLLGGSSEGLQRVGGRERAIIMSCGQGVRKGPLHCAQTPAGAHPARWCLAWGPETFYVRGPSSQNCLALWAPQSLLPEKREQQEAERSHHPAGGHLSRGRPPTPALHVPPSSALSAEAAQQSRNTTFLSWTPGPASPEIQTPHGGGRAGQEAPSPATLADVCG